MAKLPWYAFLYRLFGAQGTFWLWLIVVLALWWTAEPAMLGLANRKPVAATMAEAARPGTTTRWIQTRGVGLDLDKRLLDQREPSLPPVRLLLDPEDPAAKRWVRLRQLCGQAAGARGSLGGLLGTVPERYLPTPERALLLQGDEVPSLAAHLPVPAEPPGNQIDAYWSRLRDWCALVRARVHPTIEVRGVLDPVPQAIQERLRADLDVLPAPYLLRLERRPRELETYVFAGALILLLLLATGLYGIRRARAGEEVAEVAPPA